MRAREIGLLYHYFWCMYPASKTRQKFSKFLRSRTTSAVWERPGRKGQTQCHNCQSYFHLTDVCHLKPKCVKCAGAHKTADCPKTYENPWRYTNCDSSQPANYRIRPKFLDDQTKSIATSQGKNSKTKNASYFPTKKVNSAVSFTRAATSGVSDPFLPLLKIEKLYRPEKLGAVSDTDFLKQLLNFESTFGK